MSQVFDNKILSKMKVKRRFKHKLHFFLSLRDSKKHHILNRYLSLLFIYWLHFELSILFITLHERPRRIVACSVSDSMRVVTNLKTTSQLVGYPETNFFSEGLKI